MYAHNAVEWEYLKFTLYSASRLFPQPARSRKTRTRKNNKKIGSNTSIIIIKGPFRYNVFLSFLSKWKHSTTTTKICLALSFSFCISCCLSSILFMVCKYPIFPLVFRISFNWSSHEQKKKEESIGDLSQWNFFPSFYPYLVNTLKTNQRKIYNQMEMVNR